VVLGRLVPRNDGSQEEVTVRLRVPHCARCARLTKHVFLAGCIPFGLGYLLAGAAAFLVVAFLVMRSGLDEYQHEGRVPSLVLGSGAALIGGFAGAFLLEFGARLLLVPLYGRALLRAPMLSSQLLRDADYVAGLTTRLERDGEIIELRFDNKDLSREFALMNQLHP
jgi:hypothetical protein